MEAQGQLVKYVEGVAAELTKVLCGKMKDCPVATAITGPTGANRWIASTAEVDTRHISPGALIYINKEALDTVKKAFEEKAYCVALLEGSKGDLVISVALSKEVAEAPLRLPR